MILYLIRHGKTERQSASGRDADRLLKPRGHKQSIWLGETIAEQIADRPKDGVRLLVSGITRAWQTGGPIGERLDVAPVREPLIETGRSAADVLEVIERERKTSTLLLVGHDPHFSEALDALGRGAADTQNGLRTGQCAKFITEDGALIFEGLYRMPEEA